MSIFVIAEAGVNHNGEFVKALMLVAEAKKAGADAVKFQHFNSQRLWGDDRITHLELSEAQLTDIAAYCKAIEVEFMCTPFGVPEVEFLAPLVKRMKIASGCITRRPLLEAAAKTGLPVILSTGMSTHGEIMEAWSWFDRVTLLHCTSAYPCAIEDVNLKAMQHLPKPHGYSDHTNGITVAIAAAAMGATVIEKHLTLDRTANGPDHLSSIEPEEFRVMVSAIRTVETALGDGVKKPRECEIALREIWHGQR